MPEILQHAFVTIVAFGAAALVIRRVFTVVKPAASGSPCAACPSAKHAAAKQPAPALTAEAKPLTLFTSPPSSR